MFAFRSRLTKWVVLPVAGGLLGVSGFAVAAWLSTPSGTATVTAGVSVADAIGGAGSGLLPGGSVPVTVTVTNNNAFPEKLVSITGGTSSNGDVTLASGTYSGVTIPAGGSQNETLAATMVANPAGSPGASYSIPLSASLSTP